MRGTFINTLTELAERDPRILLLTGDLGYMALEPFAHKFPTRFFNVGVAEQNMVGLATGLAEAGFIPFVYSIATFATLRPYEFIRNGPIVHRLPVRIVGVGGGLDYSHQGLSHHGLEDVGVLHIQPGITIIAPADYAQARAALLATWDMPGPVYYRLSKDDKTLVPGLDGRFELEKIQLVRQGADLIILALGNIAAEAVAAAAILAERGVSCAVAVVATISPAPADDLSELLARFPLALTLEAHYITGGLGSLVAEAIAEHGLRCRLARCGVRALPQGISGSQDYLYHRHGLSAQSIAQTALHELHKL